LTESLLPPDLDPVAVIVLSDQVRADAADTLRYFAKQGIRLKVISGDHPATVAAVARQVGLDGTDIVVDARQLPEDARELAEVMERGTVFGRVGPQQKRAMVQALQSRGHVVAMTGDGVNDVLALKESDIGIAIGSGAPASRAVAQLVLIDGRFATLPGIVGEGRRVTSNIERVANLFITSTVYALGLSLAIVVSTLPFPFLARHLTLVGSLTIGIPAFFLALAPSRRRTRSGLVARVLKFAVPTGLVATIATFAGYRLADLEGATIGESRTTATLILAAIGLFALGIVSRPLVPWKKALIATMAGMLVVVTASPMLRDFFALDLPRSIVLLAAVGIVAITGTVMIFALRAVGWAKVVPELLREHPPTEPGAWRRLTNRMVEDSGWHRSFPTTTEMQPVLKPPPDPEE
jgi:cation-transporting ATPase E